MFIYINDNSYNTVSVVIKFVSLTVDKNAQQENISNLKLPGVDGLDLVNIYCDESRFSNPYEQYFLIGCLSCPRDQQPQIAQRLKKGRRNFGFMPELKWQNVTEAKIPYLNELLQVFFTSDLEFRCIIVDKSKLSLGNGSEADELAFYKFYYLLLKGLLKPDNGYYIFVDQRTKTGETRLGVLQRYLSKHLEDINRNAGKDADLAASFATTFASESGKQNPNRYLKQLQEIKSEESVFIQLLDVLMGSVGYYWNGFRGSPAKVKFIENLTRRLQKQDLKFSSKLYDKKWNQFVWEPKTL